MIKYYCVIFSIFLFTGCHIIRQNAPVTSQNNANGNSSTFSNPFPYANTITSNELKTHLYIYASDAFEGRETGTKGQKKAVAYLRDQYQLLDIPAAQKNGDYFQQVPLSIYNNPKISLKLNNKKLEAFRDFISTSPSATAKITGNEVVYLGYGSDKNDSPTFTKAAIEDKVVFIKLGEPKPLINLNSKKNNSYQWSTPIEEYEVKKELAFNKGAKVALFYHPQSYQRVSRWFSKRSRSMELAQKNSDQYAFFINSTVANSLINNIDNKVEPEIIPIEFSLDYTNTSKDVFSENVAAYIEGSEFPNQVIVISAHLDHEGIKNNKVYNGADDDGSGTVAILEIAEAFAKATKDGFRPRRSIMFLNVTGEEKGLLGSKYYTDINPIFPLENTVANLNIDMIGRIDAKHRGQQRNYLYLIGSDRLSTELHEISEYVNKKHTKIALDYTYNAPNDPNNFYYRSDHYNFAKNNIPVIFYFNGTHEDYHQPTDTPDKIQYDLLENRAKLIFYTAWELANRDERIVVDKMKVLAN